MKYEDIYCRLMSEVAQLIFMKSDGSIRVMLATRSVGIASLYGYDRGYMVASLNGHDRRSNKGNGNIGVIDLMIGESRSFNVSRLISITWCGEINSKDDADRIYKEHKEFLKVYDSNRLVSMDDL